MKTYKSILLIVLALTQAGLIYAQGNFVDYQKTFSRVADVFRRKEEGIKKEFKEKGLEWPAKYVYIRSFKLDSQLEVWVKNKKNESFKLFKTYKVCAMAGSLGPKRMQGDYQVPEGFYYINEFKPNSMYHLSLGLNYPNASDRMLSDSLYPGGDIYIHGSCVTEGCIPITNDQIEDLYIITSYAHAQGQEFIPVHIFPVQFNNPRNVSYLEKFVKTYHSYRSLVENLRAAYEYFEKTKQIPVVVLNPGGQYILGGSGAVNTAAVASKPRTLTPKEKPIPIPEEELARVVNMQPQFPGGAKAFQTFLENLNRELVPLLDEGQRAAYLMVDYIIDKEGKPVYAKVVKGGNDDMNELLEQKFEGMPQWKPALRQEVPVSFRLKQTIVVESAP
ncbi:MAG: L,D-transpeptidase family protein [Chitinophagaceae bacterium]|nr:L,D-transpeptidase family protein [Chitinophagaceae bacterium]MCW5926122.1 L,D-transpeptidase family protein [Chitinophagaceae bacterium]